jgi:hypothetical protein
MLIATTVKPCVSSVTLLTQVKLELIITLRTKCDRMVVGRKHCMQKVTIEVPDYLYKFYENIGKNAGGIQVEKVISDSLFKLAGELSINAIKKVESKKERIK